METIFNWLVSGYVVGMTCMTYFIIKSWILVSDEHGSVEETSEVELNWLGMALVSAGVSLAWSFIGTGITFLLKNDVLVVQLSLLALLLISLIVMSVRSHRKLDKVALHALFFLGLALILPRLL